MSGKHLLLVDDDPNLRESLKSRYKNSESAELPDSFNMPPLRERRDDIPLLLNHFLKEKAPDQNLHITEAAAKVLTAYDWPGNVRELENAVERAVALARTDTIDVDDLPPSLQESETVFSAPGQSYAHLPLSRAREAFERLYIHEVLTRTGGNITHAAKIAGIAWQNFHQKLKKYDVDAKSFGKTKSGSVQ